MVFLRVIADVPEPCLLSHCDSLITHVFKVADLRRDAIYGPEKRDLFFLLAEESDSCMNPSREA